ncbi:MAG: DUF1569 domain-containing protein [Terriglobales bacterium]
MNSYLDRLRQELESAVGGASTDQLEHAPAEKWSGTQILEHLFLTYKHTNRGLTKCLDEGRSLAKPATFGDRVATLLVVNFGYLPRGRKAPERTVPRGMAPDEARSAIAAELDKMASSLDECERKFGARVKILNHPILGPLTADEWRKFHWVHGRHHARQIREGLGEG